MPDRTPKTPTRSTSKGGSGRTGVIAGYVFRVIREQINLTRDELAESFRVSIDTVAGWETGRRPLTAVTAGQMLVYRHRLLHLGALPSLLLALDRAMEADVLISSTLDGDDDHNAAPLGAWVMQRDLVEVMAWPFTGVTPDPIRQVPAPRRARRGPVAPGPELDPADLARFFSRIRRTAETATDPRHFLLRRQALYLSGYDDQPDVASWVAEQQRTERPEGWLSEWLSARSIASVATRYGDRDRLAHFVGRTLLDDDRSEAANLNYWAYWVGESGIELTDDFIGSGTLGPWEGRRLLRHVVERLQPGHGYLDLYVHTAWALLAARPGLLRTMTGGTQGFRRRLQVLLDSPETSVQARREIDGIRYAIRLAEA